MKIVNRGYAYVRPKAMFNSWAEEQDEDFQLFGEGEPTVYLIEEDFFEEEALIKRYFKRIFSTQLESVTDDESVYPVISESTFKEWFDVQLGSMVIDLESNQLQREG